jgi:HSP20 family protein
MAKLVEKKPKSKVREMVQVTAAPPMVPVWEREFDRLVDRLTDDLRRLTWPALLGERWWPMREMNLRPPAIDMYEEKDAVIVKAELPGMTRDDIEVNLTGSTLTIKGQKQKEADVTEGEYHRSERTFGAIARSVELPAEVKPDDVQATFKDGVLHIRLPKTDEARKKQIKIQVD